MIKFYIKPEEGCEDILPSKAHIDDAGYDLFSAEDTVVLPGEVLAVSVGFRCELPKGYELQVRPKSGLALKSKITVANTPGTVDCNYRGIVKVLVYNFGDKPYSIARKTKIAQGVICALPDVEYEIKDFLSETDRGEGGFGSTGLNKNT